MALTLVLAAGGFGAGAFGALLGLGGGVLIVPMLALGFGMPFREAVAISLLAVIATSSASAATYLRRGAANLRLGLTLEVLTVIGALVGGLVAFAIDERLIAAAFAAMLVYVAISMARPRRDPRRRRRRTRPSSSPIPRHRRRPRGRGQPCERRLDEPTDEPRVAPAPTTLIASLSRPDYEVRNLPVGLALSGLAGMVSALLGVGGGIIKVPTMHLAMGLPLRAATATSNLTIGVTASASAVLYILRDAIDPLVAAPVLVGTFLGATVAARHRASRPGRAVALDLRRRAPVRGRPDGHAGRRDRGRRMSLVDGGERRTAAVVARLLDVGARTAFVLVLTGMVLMLVAGIEPRPEPTAPPAAGQLARLAPGPRATGVRLGRHRTDRDPARSHGRGRGHRFRAGRRPSWGDHGHCRPGRALGRALRRRLDGVTMETLIILFASFAIILIGAELFTNGIEWVGRKLDLAEGAVGSVLAAVGTALPETMIPLVAILAGGAASSHEIGIGAILGAPFMLATLAMFVTGVAVIAARARRKTGITMDIEPVVVGKDVRFFLLTYGLAIAVAFAPIEWAWVRPARSGRALRALRRLCASPLRGRVADRPRRRPRSAALPSPGPECPSHRPGHPASQGRQRPGPLRTRPDHRGAVVFVGAVTEISASLGISATLLALVIAPIATELPEKLNSVIWVRQGKDTLAIGNISGAMVFQACFPTAVALLFAPESWTISPESTIAFLSAAIAIVSTIAIFLPMARRSTLTGRGLLIGGVFYVAYLAVILGGGVGAT